MAIELMARILARPRDEIDPGEKLVLVVMADRADDDGFLWYAIDTIADKTSFTRRAVQRIMARLIQKGLVRKQHRRDRSNFYIIQVDRFPNVERKRRLKETGPAEYIDGFEEVEPDLFCTGDRRSKGGERRSSTGDLGSQADELGSPNSLNDSLNDSPTDAQAREGGFDLRSFLIGSWNELAGQHAALPTVNDVSDARLSKAETRAKEWKARGSPEDVWRSAFVTIAQSKLLTGNKTSWAATLDWVLGPKNFTKIMEGNYGHGHDRVGAVSNDPANRSAAAAGREARKLVTRAREQHAAQRSGGHSRGFAGANR